jgi:hypothetical protein
MEIHVLEQLIQSGSCHFPIYVGFMTAADLLKVAEVPNFSPSTSNEAIATNVLTPPVKQWQRPLIHDKQEAIIKIFDSTGDFMPNPVLLAERCVGAPPQIAVAPLMAAGNIPTAIKVVTIPQKRGQQAPLWIIDGQHRITGLGDLRCKQKDNPIPVVLLLNSGGNFYNGRNLAKIFAQVTTAATPLEPLHKEWLTFAFQLEPYGQSTNDHKAMECVAELCKSPHNSLCNEVNPFHDDIKFNDSLSTSAKFLGHLYDCKDLSKLLSTNYYGESSNIGHLPAKQLAEQVSMAFIALKQNVKAPQDKSVFFGKGKQCHKIMCDAFLVGVLSFLRKQNMNPNKPEWVALLKKLNFHQTDWDFQQHVISSSRWVEKSKSLASDVFSNVFANATLPDGVNDIWDYLSGDKMFVELEFKHVNSNGKAVQRDRHVAKFGRGDKKTVPMHSRKYFRVCDRSVNAKHIEIVDEKSSPSAPIIFKTTGEHMREPKVRETNATQDPLVLTIKCTLYGGVEERLTISLASWK